MVSTPTTTRSPGLTRAEPLARAIIFSTIFIPIGRFLVALLVRAFPDMFSPQIRIVIIMILGFHYVIRNVGGRHDPAWNCGIYVIFLQLPKSAISPALPNTL